ncbi:M20 family metallopeptidase [Falsibacillus pallidus]|uniref:Peptidase M20 domain-containing protein 2 n=1 Tax=Falsibacillus pallidus TaxID=493781 RepID=A0A370GHF9_9BACI|nr:M20 family metallopeptidase [Falsibacillus pallidus]RDI43238.1 amidohydrolase [Falsibacillus pallidus]
MKQKLIELIDSYKSDFYGISEYIFQNPELGDQEYKSSAKLMEYLKSHGFNIEENIVGRPTAFKAEFDSGKPGAVVAYLCEYDALPEIGHGCGHNMIGTMSMAAGIMLSKVVNETGGKVIVLGTPAEETNGAKVPMAEQGIFDGIDAAMMVHPSGLSYKSGNSLAMDAIQFEYHGKTSHAAASPEKGINALDAVLMLFNGINAMRQQVRQDVRMHGIIKDGGVAANVIPDYACAQFYFRAKDREYLNEIVERVKNIAKGAESMTGAKLEISNYELSYDDMITNQQLSEAFTKNMELAGAEDVQPASKNLGSLDMGNVSHVVPAIHPYIGLGKADLIGHTRELADLTVSEQGRKALIQGTTALALTGYDLLSDDSLLKEVKEEFNNSVHA